MSKIVYPSESATITLKDTTYFTKGSYNVSHCDAWYINHFNRQRKVQKCMPILFQNPLGINIISVHILNNFYIRNLYSQSNLNIVASLMTHLQPAAVLGIYVRVG